MLGQPFGEPVSHRRCWACSSDDLTESTWVIVDRHLVCGACIRGQRVPRIVAFYRGRADALRRSLHATYATVVDFKERQPGWPALGPLLASALAKAIMTVAAVHGLPNNTMVVPVPSYRDRRPHMRDLCSLAERELSGVTVAAALCKTRDFRQAHIRRATARRAANVGAFVVREDVDNRSVIVADDMVTTGATMSSCAHALYRAGAAQVFGAAIVRVVRKPRDGLVVHGYRQVKAPWREVNDNGCTPMSASRAAIWVRFACGKRCPLILTAGPFSAPAVSTESLHEWECECRTKHIVTLQRNAASVAVAIGSRQPSELLIALRHYRA
jgi:predicted amidophosphoribosyltransferase